LSGTGRPASARWPVTGRRERLSGTGRPASAPLACHGPPGEGEERGPNPRPTRLRRDQERRPGKSRTHAPHLEGFRLRKGNREVPKVVPGGREASGFQTAVAAGKYRPASAAVWNGNPEHKKNTTMKMLLEILDMTAEGRAKFLKTTVTTARNAKTTIAKILVAAEEKGDYGSGEMNTYAQRLTGVELRREIQGVYEAVNTLKGIRAGTVPMTEEQFEKCPDFGRVTISGLLSKAPGFVPEACAIIESGEDVTKRLKALRDAVNGKKPKEEVPKPETAKESSPEAEGPEGEASGFQTAPAADADTFVIPHKTPVVNCDPLMERLMREVKTAPTKADAALYIAAFAKLQAHAESRLEELEAQASATPAPAAAESRELAVA
jgi:hypothetical protein